MWVIQRNLGNGDGFERLEAALKFCDITYRAVDIVPFSDDYPEVEWDGAIIAYGSTKFVTNVHDNGAWLPGVFFDHEAFSMRAYIERYGQHILNANAILMTVSEFLQQGYDADRAVFVRPQRDLKEFEARVCKVSELETWFATLCAGDYELGADTLIVVAEPVEITMEWRAFMVDEQYCSGSQYMKNGVVDICADVPQDVIKFSNEMAAIWSPEKAFALDIGLVGDALKVIEINCFNSSGFYASDVNKIVKAVSGVDDI